jgi:hypothetical protein
VRLGKAHDADDQRRRQADQQGRAEIDRQEIISGAGGEADRAEECPGRAVDRQRQRIDQQPVAPLTAEQSRRSP